MGDKKFLEDVGHRIRRKRFEQNLTQFELAVRCNFEKASMSRIENGLTNPTLLTMRKISKALDVHIADLLRD